MSQYTKSTNFATKDNLTPGDPLKVVRGTEIDTEFNNIATAVATKTDNASAAITGGSITGITDLAIADGGTGASTATAALNNLLPSQTGNANKYLQTDGSNATWDPISLSTSDITGTLPVANGGTGVTSSTGTGSVVLSNSPTLVTPALGTPASGVATNLTGLPISTGVSGLGTGVATFLGTPSSANLASAVSDETGTGALVFANSPTLVTPTLGTPASATLTNATGLPVSTGISGLGTGVATFLATPSSANLCSALTDETGTGSAVFATSPALVTPDLGTPSAATLTNATGLPISTGVSGLGTGVATFLATPSSANLRSALTDETGTGSAVFATSPTLVTPILGTPQSGNFSTGTFTWPTFNQNTTGTAAGLSATLATTSGGTGLTSFTSGGVVYASSTSALATGSALTFDGTILKIYGAANEMLRLDTVSTATDAAIRLFQAGVQKANIQAGVGVTGGGLQIDSSGSTPIMFGNSSELMRLTSTGLGIGTSSPARKLDAQSTTADYQLRLGYNSSFYYDIGRVNSNGYLGFYGSQTGATGFTFGGVDGTRMTLDSAGNLGLGVTPSAWGSGSKALQINSNLSLWSASSTNNYIYANAYYDGTNDKYVSTAEAARIRFAGATTIFNYAASGTANANITWQESFRTDTSGNLLVGTTSSLTSKVGIQYASNVESGISIRNTVASYNTAVSFLNTSGTQTGYITGGETSVSYITSSDYRLKNTIAPMTGALAKVALLKPCTYKWNADGSDGEGFIAHELAEVVPQCVTGEKDAVDEEGNPKYQGIDTSFLVATLTAAIQELKAEFDAYKASHP